MKKCLVLISFFCLISGCKKTQDITIQNQKLLIGKWTLESQITKRTYFKPSSSSIDKIVYDTIAPATDQYYLEFKNDTASAYYFVNGVLSTINVSYPYTLSNNQLFAWGTIKNIETLTSNTLVFFARDTINYNPLMVSEVRETYHK